jgi:hypothetical protein
MPINPRTGQPKQCGIGRNARPGACSEPFGALADEPWRKGDGFLCVPLWLTLSSHSAHSDSRERIVWREPQSPNLAAARAFAFAASSSRFFDGALVSSERSNRAETPATSSTAARNEASFAFDGLVNPQIFLTNCSDAARTSSSVTGGSKLKRILMFLHMHLLCPTPRPMLEARVSLGVQTLAA